MISPRQVERPERPCMHICIPLSYLYFNNICNFFSILHGGNLQSTVVNKLYVAETMVFFYSEEFVI